MRSPLTLPTRLRTRDLLALTDRLADEVLAGRYDHTFPASGLPSTERWSVRLRADEEVDIWLISWVRDRSTELHDHAGSLGALTVVSGAVSEYRWDGTTLRQRVLAAGDRAAFPIGWVHDVMRVPDHIALTDRDRALVGPLDPTLTVHAYSPPLTAMSYYSLAGPGRLVRNRTVLTTDPESGS